MYNDLTPFSMEAMNHLTYHNFPSRLRLDGVYNYIIYEAYFKLGSHWLRDVNALSEE